MWTEKSNGNLRRGEPVGVGPAGRRVGPANFPSWSATAAAKQAAVSRIYLDDASSAPVFDEVRQALRQLPESNPSSPYGEGRAARAALDAARDMAARALSAGRTEVTFTSSGTEAVNLALFGAARRPGARGIIATWASEHHSVLGAVRRLQSEGHTIAIQSVDRAARADPDDIPNGAILVSIGLANNEVGTIQPVAEIIHRAHEIDALVHVDACAGPPWIPIPAGADLVSLSGHKLGAGRGGILLVRDGVRIDPLFYGGPQEWGRRAGHEDVNAATAIATALVICARDRETQKTKAAGQAESLRGLLEEIGGVLTCAEPHLPNYASCAFSDRRGEDLLLSLDLAGIAASSGSACASGSLDPSHVLLAMGLDLKAALG
ncbi:MAG: aminotransferase class V-fold PLP-dependent enzyme, partial [Chloroflexi bacterium]